jgi:hypothetical protein
MPPAPTALSLLRDVNARIREISDRFGTDNGCYRLLCECGREGCHGRVEVPVAAFDEARRRAQAFLAQGHVLGG